MSRDHSSDDGGLGLGLAISQAVVNIHHGTIRAESAGAGHGATFTVTLATVTAPEAPVARTPDSAAGSPALRLLVVEDHQATRDALTRLLARQGHQVTASASKQEAIAAFAADHYDVVISDLGLPGGTGVELMQELRRRRPVPAIALTGYGMENDLRETQEAGFLAHLVKPVNFEQLCRLLLDIHSN